MRKEKTLFERMRELGEENFPGFTKEVLSHPSLASALDKAVRNATAAKGTVDKNIAAILSLLNVPSKADYDRLLTKVETLQGNLVNVNIKLDRLLAAQAKPRKRSTGKKKAPTRK